MTPSAPQGLIPFDLSTLTFSAKIDFVTVYSAGRTPLPALQGKARWARREHYRKLTVHDPSPLDLKAIAESFDNPRLAEIEVAVDVAPSGQLTDVERAAIIDALMVELFGRCLNPAVACVELRPQFRGAFEGTRVNFRLRPFNRKLPAPYAQQLHGKRVDPLQVKCYAKKTDQGRNLSPKEYVARAEVRLSGDGLHHHGLTFVTDLQGFRYRKVLMPYFRHIRSALPRRRGGKRQSPLLAVLRAKQHEILLDEMARVGVGALLRGGRHEDADVRLLRNTPVNDRIGQALLRLERRMKFVRSDSNGA